MDEFQMESDDDASVIDLLRLRRLDGDSFVNLSAK